MSFQGSLHQQGYEQGQLKRQQQQQPLPGISMTSYWTSTSTSRSGQWSQVDTVATRYEELPGNRQANLNVTLSTPRRSRHIPTTGLRWVHERREDDDPDRVDDQLARGLMAMHVSALPKTLLTGQPYPRNKPPLGHQGCRLHRCHPSRENLDVFAPELSLGNPIADQRLIILRDYLKIERDGGIDIREEEEEEEGEGEEDYDGDDEKERIEACFSVPSNFATNLDSDDM